MSVFRGLDQAMRDVRAERIRQAQLHGDQSHLPDGTGGPGLQTIAEYRRRQCEGAAQRGALTFRDIFDEEVAEVLAEDDPARLRAELVQVAAVCVQWIQAIDGRRA